MSHAPALRALAAVAALLAAFVRARLAALEFAAEAAPPVRRLAPPRRARLSNASLAETLPLGGVDSLAPSASALFAGLSTMAAPEDNPEYLANHVHARHRTSAFRAPARDTLRPETLAAIEGNFSGWLRRYGYG